MCATPFHGGFSQFAVFHSGKPHFASPRRHYAFTPEVQRHFHTGSFLKAVVIKSVLDKYTVHPNSGVLQVLKKKKAEIPVCFLLKEVCDVSKWKKQVVELCS